MTAKLFHLSPKALEKKEEKFKNLNSLKVKIFFLDEIESICNSSSGLSIRQIEKIMDRTLIGLCDVIVAVHVS